MCIALKYWILTGVMYTYNSSKSFVEIKICLQFFQHRQVTSPSGPSCPSVRRLYLCSSDPQAVKRCDGWVWRPPSAKWGTFVSLINFWWTFITVFCVMRMPESKQAVHPGRRVAPCVTVDCFCSVVVMCTQVEKSSFYNMRNWFFCRLSWRLWQIYWFFFCSSAWVFVLLFRS